MYNHERRLCGQLQTSIYKEQNIRKVELLQALANLYCQRAKLAERIEDYPKAAILYNVTQRFCKKEKASTQLGLQLLEVEHQFLSNVCKCGSKAIAKHLNKDISQKVSSVIKKMRGDSRQRVEKILDMVDNIFHSDDKSVVTGQEETIIQETKMLCLRLRQAYKELVKTIVSHCEEALGHTPCKYAVLGVGDISTDSLTPYSGIELIILVEDTKGQTKLNYFQNLFHYMCIIIAGIAETPIHISGIKTFHDIYNSSNNAFPDLTTPLGISIDMSRTTNNINPLGFADNTVFKDRSSFSFINCPSKMCDMLKEENVSKLGIQSSVRLLQATFLHGNESLFIEYEDKVQDIIAHKMNNDLRYHLHLAFELLKSLSVIRKDRFDIDIWNTSLIQPMYLKDEIESFSTLLQGVRLCHRIHAKTSWTIIDALKTKLLLSDTGLHNLKYATAIGFLLRINMTLKHQGRQVCKGILKNNDWRSQRPNILKTMIGLTDPKTLVRFYRSLMPLCQILQQCVQFKKRPVFTASSLLKEGYVSKATVSFRLLKFNETLDGLRKEIESVELFTVPDKSEVMYGLYTMAGNIAMYMRQTRLATSYFDKAMEEKETIVNINLKMTSFAATWHSFGLIHKLDGKNQKAVTYFQDALAMYQENYFPVGTKEDELVATISSSLASVKLEMGYASEAIALIDKALFIYSKIPGYLLSATVMDLHYKAGQALKMTAEYKSSMIHYKYALDIAGYTSGDIHPTLCKLYDAISEAENHMGKSAISQMYNYHALQLQEYHIGKMIVNPDDLIMLEKKTLNWELVKTLEHLADTYCISGNLKQASLISKSILTHIQSVAMGSMFHPQLTRAHFKVGQIYQLQHKSKEALEHLLEAKTLLNKLGSDERPLAALYIHTMVGQCQIDMDELKKGREELSRAQVLVERVYDYDCHPELIRINNIVGDSFVKELKFQDAIQIFQKCIDLQRKLYGKVHSKIASSLLKLGSIINKTGEFNKALAVMQEALGMMRRIHTDNNAKTEIAAALATIAQMYTDMNRGEAAERYLTESIQIKKISGGDPMKQLLDLGKIYHNKGKYAKSIAVHKEALDILYKSDVKNDADVSKVAAQIGKDYYILQLYADAVRMFDLAIDSKRKRLQNSEDKLQLAGWLTNLGKAYDGLGDLEKGSECHLEALYTKRKILGECAVDKDMITSMECIAHSHEQKGNYRKAIYLRKEAVQNSRNLDGSDVPTMEILDSLNAIANGYRKVGEFQNALKYQLEYHKMQAELYPDNQTSMISARSLNNIGHCYEALGDHTNAIQYFEKSLLVFKSVHINDQRTKDIATCLCAIGYAYYGSGDSETALEYLTKAVSDLRNDQPRAKDKLAETLYKLGEVYVSIPEYVLAEEAHRESLVLMCQVHTNKPHESMAHSLRAMGSVLFKLGQYAKGVEHIESAYQMLKILNGPDVATSAIADTLLELGEGYSKVSRYVQAVKTLSKALHMYRQVHGQHTSNLNIARCLASLSFTHKRARQYQEAISYSTEAVLVYGSILQHPDLYPDVAVLTRLLGDCCKELGMLNDSWTHYKKASQMFLALHNGDVLQTDVVDTMKQFENVSNLIKKIPTHN